MRLALFQRGCARGFVVDETNDDAIQIRQSLAPVVRVLIEADELAPTPFNKLERTRTDGTVGVGVALDITLTENMLRQDRALVARQSSQHVGRGVVELEDRRMVVRGLDGGDIAEGTDAAWMRFF